MRGRVSVYLLFVVVFTHTGLDGLSTVPRKTMTGCHHYTILGMNASPQMVRAGPGLGALLKMKGTMWSLKCDNYY